MKNVKNVLTLLMISGMLTFLISCSDDDAGKVKGVVSVSVSSVQTSTGRIGARTNAAVVVITDFQISIRDVVFKSDGDSTDVAFTGPYALDLLDETGALSQSIGDAEIPFGIYEELRFKLHKTEDVATTHPLFDRSIFIMGTIDGIPFEMWHDTSENLDIGKATGVVVDENGVSLVVTFSIDQFLSSETAIDLSLAIDENQDGLIEINPNDDDGNKDIADALKDNIKAAADLLEEL